MKYASLILSLLLFVPLWAQSSPSKDSLPSAESPLFDAWGDSVWTEGMMRADNLSEKTELAFDTVTKIECYKHGGRLLVDTDAYCLQASASVSLGMPVIDIEYLPVKSWEPDLIVAASSPSAKLPDCIWSQITINLREKSVMVTDIKKTGKGHEGFNGLCRFVPLSQTYHLVSTTSEMARRNIRAAKNKSPR